MIELTQEQWQAIARESNPTVVDPHSHTAYVVIRKDLFDKLKSMSDSDTAPPAILDALTAQTEIGLTEPEKALALRMIWMRRMGLDEEEIVESLRADPPTHVSQEMKELIALEKLKSRPSIDVLRKLAIKY